MPTGAFGAVRPVGAILPTATAAGPFSLTKPRTATMLRRPLPAVMTRCCFPLTTDDCDSRRRILRRRGARHHHIRKKASEMNQKPLQWR